MRDIKIWKLFKLEYFLIISIFVLVSIGVYSNIKQQESVDESKLPAKIETDRGFQRWITNMKNHEVEVKADDFWLYEKAEIYNNKWLKISSFDEPGKKEEFEKILEEHKDIKKVVFAPNEREFVDYREIIKTVSKESKDTYPANIVLYYGQKDNKIIEARILECTVKNGPCYFDRTFFVTNDVFIISEISKSTKTKNDVTDGCPVNDMCKYTIKLHVIDLINNSRTTYESKPLDINLEKLIRELTT